MRCDQAAEQICDFRQGFVKLCYGAFFGMDFKEKGPAYAENIKKNLQPFETFLGDNKWLAGENLTWAGKVSVSILSWIDVALHYDMLTNPIFSPRFYSLGNA